LHICAKNITNKINLSAGNTSAKPLPSEIVLWSPWFLQLQWRISLFPRKPLWGEKCSCLRQSSLSFETTSASMY